MVTGIDVSKALLDVSLAEGPVHRFANSDPGIRDLLRHMARALAQQGRLGSVVLACVSLRRRSPRKSTDGLPGSSSVDGNGSSLDRKLLRLADASIRVPSTQK